MSRVPIAKVLLIISFPLLDRSNRLFGGSSFILSNLQARHAFNRSIPPASGSFIRLDYEKKGKKRKGPLLQLSITPRTIAAFRCAITVDLVKLYSSALEDNKTSIRRERIIERRRLRFLPYSAYPNRISPLFPPSFYILHSWNKLIEPHLVREVLFSCTNVFSLSSSGFRSMEFNENVFERTSFFPPSSNIAFVSTSIGTLVETRHKS